MLVFSITSPTKMSVVKNAESTRGRPSRSVRESAPEDTRYLHSKCGRSSEEIWLEFEEDWGVIAAKQGSDVHCISRKSVFKRVVDDHTEAIDTGQPSGRDAAPAYAQQQRNSRELDQVEKY